MARRTFSVVAPWSGSWGCLHNHPSPLKMSEASVRKNSQNLPFLRLSASAGPYGVRRGGLPAGRGAPVGLFRPHDDAFFEILGGVAWTDETVTRLLTGATLALLGTCHPASSSGG